MEKVKAPKSIETWRIVYSKPMQDKLESMSRKERRDYMREHGGFGHPKRFKVKRGGDAS